MLWKFNILQKEQLSSEVTYIEILIGMIFEI